jgi:hypothetical protein
LCNILLHSTDAKCTRQLEEVINPRICLIAGKDPRPQQYIYPDPDRIAQIWRWSYLSLVSVGNEIWLKLT